MSDQCNFLFLDQPTEEDEYLHPQSYPRCTAEGTEVHAESGRLLCEPHHRLVMTSEWQQMRDEALRRFPPRTTA